MPLDSNLFVLAIVPRVGSPGCVDFKEEGKDDKLVYSACKEGDKIHLVDPWTDDTLYASLSMNTGPKLRQVQCVEPELVVDLKNTGNLGWRYTFEWEANRYDWERSSSSLLGSERAFTLSISRKPDPDFPIAIFSPAAKRKPNLVQLLDYNISRIEPPIQDKKGFEIVTLLSLLSFIDHLFVDPLSSAGTSTSTAAAAAAITSDSAPPGAPPPLASTSADRPKPRPPPAPPSRAAGSAPILSSNELDVHDVAMKESDLAKCLSLLKDESILWIMLIGRKAEIVPHVVALAETVKRQRYKASGEELKQFVDDDVSSGTNGMSDRFATPTSIRIYLSRIDMTDLLPNYSQRKANKPIKPQRSVRPPIVLDWTASKSGSGSSGKDKEKVKDEGGGGLFGWGRRS